ncbi:MAG: hypothetical protein RLZZ579_1024 [Actinomycetota bacterium]|jgi:hypothetical protein
MKPLLLTSTVLTTLSLTACSPAEIASNAADAAACSATHASLETLSGLYRDGLVDSGVIQQVQALIGEPVQALLSTGLAQDFKDLGEIISSSGPAEETAQKIDTLVADIKTRCEAVGVTFSE